MDDLYNCNSGNPERCARCEVRVNSSAPQGQQVYGECVCTQPRRCAACTMGTHYRLSDKCVKCPDNPWLTILAIVFLVIGAIVGSWVLNKKQFNLAFISIGVDYFQVLAMFATSSIK